MKQLNKETRGLHKKPWHKKWWVWLLIVIGVIILIIVQGFFNEVSRIRLELEAGNIDPYLFADESTRSELPDITPHAASPDVESRDDPFKGPANASVVVVEFGDFQCPFCRQSFPTVRELSEKYKTQVKFIWRDFPLSSVHPDAQAAAEAGECAQEQGGFWAYHDTLFINQHDLSADALVRYAQQVGLDSDSFSNCLTSRRFEQEVIQDLQAGISAGVQGTPTFFINGERLEGAIPSNIFKQILDEALKAVELP
jgi:protein-disulfide isomerase